jgi:Electron transfer DM13/Bacterial Ig-like domain (group 2)
MNLIKMSTIIFFLKTSVRPLMLFSFFVSMVLVISFSCSKKTPDTPVAMVPERLTLSAVNESILIGGTTSFLIKYFNGLGVEAAVPAGIIWSVSNPAIATVDQQGMATGVSVGQTEIMITYKTITAKALLNVVANNTQIAVVEIAPNPIDLLLNENITLTAMVKNINGDLIPGKTITWETDSVEYADINATSGLATAKGYGTAHITAIADGIKSSPALVHVIRRGDFSGMSSNGMAKLKIEGGVLNLQTTSGFLVSTGPPDLRIYLGNNNTNIDGAVEVASLTDRSGAQTWNLPASVKILDYRYVIVWCKQFGGTYGVADMGQ